MADDTKRWPSDKVNHILVVKMPCKMYHICKSKYSLSSLPSLKSDVLVAYNLASDWLCTFLQPGYHCSL